MEKNGLYARLYSMQFRNPDEELSGLLARGQNELGNGKETSTNGAGYLKVIK